MTIKLIMIDMDGTLLRDDKSYDTDRFYQVTKRFTDQGGIMTIATGNTHRIVEDIIDSASLDLCHQAVFNGNVIRGPHGMSEYQAIEQEDIAKLNEYITSLDYQASWILAGIHADYGLNIRPEAQKMVNHYFPHLISVESLALVPKEDPIILSQYYNPTVTLEAVKDLSSQVRKAFPDLACVSSGEGWMDIFNPAGGKGAAARYLQTHYNIKSEETMVFGDSPNDLTMMAEATYSMAMGNADIDVLAASNYQIGYNNDQAVIQVIEDYLVGGIASLAKYSK